MKLESLNLGLSPLTGTVYLGKTDPKNTNTWKGEKHDITNNFMDVLLHKFEPNTSTNISINGSNKYRIIVLDIDRKFTVDGEIINLENEND